VSELKAGRELDALVAEKVMGWTQVRNSKPEGFSSLWRGRPPGNLATLRTIPDYSTDISDAWKVVEKVDNRNGVAREMGVLTASISRYDNGYTVRFFNSGVTADTAPLAICLAALKAVAVA
jgi:Phage ABA sandwich domain